MPATLDDADAATCPAHDVVSLCRAADDAAVYAPAAIARFALRHTRCLRCCWWCWCCAHATMPRVIIFPLPLFLRSLLTLFSFSRHYWWLILIFRYHDYWRHWYAFIIFITPFRLPSSSFLLLLSFFFLSSFFLSIIIDILSSSFLSLLLLDYHFPSSIIFIIALFFNYYWLILLTLPSSSILAIIS